MPVSHPRTTSTTIAPNHPHPHQSQTARTTPINPATWMHDLTTQNPSTRLWKITNFRLPGTHNSATYGQGTSWTAFFSGNWRCQDVDLYVQLTRGIRYLDVRLRREQDGSWWPCHGIARKTGDVLAFGQGEAAAAGERRNALLGQIARFAREYPGEFVVVEISAGVEEGGADGLWSTVFGALGDRLTRVPRDATDVPTWEDVVQTGRNVVMTGKKSDDTRPVDETIRRHWEEFVWPSSASPTSGHTRRWLAVPYTDETWHSGRPSECRRVTEKFIQDHEAVITSREHFWVAPCQLTPSFGGPYWRTSFSYSPRSLTRVANPYSHSILVISELWRRHASIMVFDFPDAELIEGVIGMNV